MQDFDPFASDAPTAAWYGGERVEVVERFPDERGTMLATIRYADGTKVTVYDMFVSCAWIGEVKE